MLRTYRETQSNGKKKMPWTFSLTCTTLNILWKISHLKLKWIFFFLEVYWMFRFHNTLQQGLPLKQWDSLTGDGWVLIAAIRAVQVRVRGQSRHHGLPIPAGGFFQGAEAWWLWWCSIHELDAIQADETCPSLESSFKHELSSVTVKIFALTDNRVKLIFIYTKQF